MERGFYTAASGMLTQQKKLSAYSNNMANVSTTGYKKDNLIAGTFGEHLAVRMNTYGQTPLHDIGGGVWMQTVDSEYVDHTQGAFEATNRALDLAVAGEGFFVIATPEGEALTRDGQFALDEEGYLVLPGFGRVQGEGGDIQIGVSEFLVDRSGYIYLPAEEEDEEPEQIDRLLLAVPGDLAELKKNPQDLFLTENYTQAEENSSRTAVLQGQLERSNVNMAEEMTRVMASQRGLQSASQLVKMYDELAEQANSRLSKV